MTTRETTHLVYMTVGTQEEATRLSKMAVEEKLAACANLLPSVTSIYEWEGTLHEDSEVVVVLKTQASRLDALTRRLVEAHSYDCPCVVALPLQSGNPEFLKWVGRQTAE